MNKSLLTVIHTACHKVTFPPYGASIFGPLQKIYSHYHAYDVYRTTGNENIVKIPEEMHV